VDLRVDDLHRKPLHFCPPGKRSVRNASDNIRVCQQSLPGIMRPLFADGDRRLRMRHRGPAIRNRICTSLFAESAADLQQNFSL
jgi:hypothetical protein